MLYDFNNIGSLLNIQAYFHVCWNWCDLKWKIFVLRKSLCGGVDSPLVVLMNAALVQLLPQQIH